VCGQTDLRVKVDRASGRFRRTKIVSVMPQLVIVNALDADIYMRQNDAPKIQKVIASLIFLCQPTNSVLITC
jgi:hypothetical protein